MRAEWATYLHAISLVLGLGAFAAAAELYGRIGRRRSFRVLDGYAGWLALAVGLGVLVLGAGPVLGRGDVSSLALGLLVGCAAGIAARWCDRAIMRASSRRRVRTGSPARVARTPRGGMPRTTPAPGALLLGGGPGRVGGSPRPPMPANAQDPRQFPLVTVVVIAVLEEAFYRGVLLRSALGASSWWADLLLVGGTLLAFSLSHVYFGWAHVLAKTPLGVMALVSVLTVGSLLPAVTAHVLFNVSVWRDLARPAGRSS
jgi:hypothetical protein